MIGTVADALVRWGFDTPYKQPGTADWGRARGALLEAGMPADLLGGLSVYRVDGEGLLASGPRLEAVFIDTTDPTLKRERVRSTELLCVGLYLRRAARASHNTKTIQP